MGAEEIAEELVVKDFPKLIKGTKPQVQKAYRPKQSWYTEAYLSKTAEIKDTNRKYQTQLELNYMMFGIYFEMMQ